MAKVFIGNSGYKLFLGNNKIKRAYLGNTLVYSGEINVRYHVDDAVELSYIESFEEGNNCLSPKSFNPASLKPGFAFLGWKLNRIPAGDVLEELLAGSDDIDLYAVYIKDYTVNYYNASTTPTTIIYRMYYNNGLIQDPITTAEETTLKPVSTFKTPLGWTTIVNSTTQQYANGSQFTIKSDMNLYSVYSQNVTVYIVNGGSSGPVKSTFTGMRFRQYNSSTTFTINPSITLTHNDISGWNNAGWNITAGSATKIIDDGVLNVIDSYDGKTIYALYSKDVTFYLMNGSSNGGVKSTINGKRYTQYTDTVRTINGTVSISHTAISGWTNNGWNLGENNTTPTAQDGNVEILPTYDNNILYALYKYDITVTWYTGLVNATVEKKPRCIRAIQNSWSVTNPSYSKVVNNVSGWTVAGWATNASTTTASYASGATFTRDSNANLYALYKQNISVTWYNNTTTASVETKNRFMRPLENKTWGYTNPSFARNVTAVSGWNILGWTTSQTYVTAATYASGATFTRDSNITLFAAYKKDITMSVVHTGATRYTATKAAYYNRGLGSSASQFYPTFSYNNPSYSGKTFKGWSTSSGSQTIAKTSLVNISLTNSTTFYAVWKNADKVVFDNPSGQQWSVGLQFSDRNEIKDIINVNYNDYSAVVIDVDEDHDPGEWATATWSFVKFFPGTDPTIYPENIPYNVEIRAINWWHSGGIVTDRGICARGDRNTSGNIPLYKTSGNISSLKIAFQGDMYRGWVKVYKITAIGRTITW